MDKPKIVSRAAWLEARKAHMEKEKAFTRMRDELSAERRALPWVEVTEAYAFATAKGNRSLAELFDGKDQLVVYHFMFGPDWKEGCRSCSFWADNFERNVVHLAARNIALIAASRAPLETLESYRERMGWTFNWVSSLDTTFNEDFGVTLKPEDVEAGNPTYNFGTRSFPSTEAPGVSVFVRDEDGRVFHTYSTYARGLDMLNAGYHYMDLTPRGRDEDELPYSMMWLRRRDEYTPATS